MQSSTREEYKALIESVLMRELSDLELDKFMEDLRLLGRRKSWIALKVDLID